ncbi:MAG TPA: hypothetical protein VGQ10_08075 [Vicinamibacterales bacterium]|jgi:hypothetical protein|nr:hypothetical protein [Vicinamibacterales bacterium]
MRACRLVLVALAMLATGCGGVLKPEYEYEEELYLSLDGSATLYVNASVPALVALRGVDLDVNPRARFDRARVRSLFQAPGVDVRVSSSRRHGRRFVYVRVDAASLEELRQAAPLAWSTYQFARKGDVFEFHQIVGNAAGKPVGNVGWTGRELVAFRMHLPSRIPYHNAPSHTVERGNILVWEQPLTARLKSEPLDIQAQLETESILVRTLVLFGWTIVAAALAFALVIWWMARKGRESEMAESRP